LLFCFSFLYAQSDYYWYEGKKIPLTKLETKKYILFEGTDKNVFRNNLNRLGVELKKLEVLDKNLIKKEEGTTTSISYQQWAIIESEDQKKMNSLKSIADIIYEAPFFINDTKDEAGLTQYFYVRLNKEADLHLLSKMALLHNVDIVERNEYMPLWYTLSCNKSSSGNSLELSNIFYETGLFGASHPDMLVEFQTTCVNDSYFNKQWGLKNNGMNGWTGGIDINFCEAQAITKGSGNVIVAVFDNGIQLDHPDLTNIYRLSYDSESNSSPSRMYDSGVHGTNCAGIIGATANNSRGVAGIAPLCPIMPISNMSALTVQSVKNRANGLNFAWQNGAAVISNSWKANYSFSIITDAIKEAMTKGRNGLGCIVVFAAGNGNDNSPSVTYPANTDPDILVVGAISPCGERVNANSCDGIGVWESSYGQSLDIMAPGVYIPTTTINGQYDMEFRGTSAACPHVAGVAALVLSLNPQLTRKQVVDIIESTAKKLPRYSFSNNPGTRPNGTWNNEVGYGLIDAAAAVRRAQCNGVTYISNRTFTSNSTFQGCEHSINNSTVTRGKLTVISSISTTITSNFTVNLGAELEIR